MPDIAMCMNDKCPRAAECYRHEATPSKHRQSYAMFNPKDQAGCEWFWPIEKKEERRHDVP